MDGRRKPGYEPRPLLLCPRSEIDYDSVHGAQSRVSARVPRGHGVRLDLVEILVPELIARRFLGREEVWHAEPLCTTRSRRGREKEQKTSQAHAQGQGQAQEPNPACVIR